MPRIQPLTTNDAPAKSRPLLEGVEKKFGMVPNIMATMAHSPAAFEAYLKFGEAVGGGTLSASLREQIALAVAGENACGYCAAAHTAIGKMTGLGDDELERNLTGESTDTRAQAAIDFAKAVVRKRGWIDGAELDAVRAAGFDDGAVVEIIAAVAINTFTNYFNHIAETDIDFPEVAVPARSGA